MLDARKREAIDFAASIFTTTRRDKILSTRDTSTVAAAIYDLVLGPYLPALSALPHGWLSRDDAVSIKISVKPTFNFVSLKLPAPRPIPQEPVPIALPGVTIEGRWGLTVSVTSLEGLTHFADYVGVLQDWADEDTVLRNETYQFQTQISNLLSAHDTLADALLTFPSLSTIIPAKLMPRRKSKASLGRPAYPDLLEKVDIAFLSTIILSGKMMGATCEK